MLHEGEHSTAQQHRKNNEIETEIPERKKIRPLSCNNVLPDWNTLHPSTKKEQIRTAELLSQSRTPPAPLATTSLPIRSG